MAFSVGRFTSPTGFRHTNTATTTAAATTAIGSSSSTAQTDQLKHKILAQNRALAKKNSILMTKIADLETRISDLIQQNIELRALNAKNEDQKRRWLEGKLSVIEEGVSQRFEEMFQMFATIRHNEGLGASPMGTGHVIANASQDTSVSEKTVSFHNAKSPKKLSTKERRRRTARRESMYIAPPSPESAQEVNSQPQNAIRPPQEQPPTQQEKEKEKEKEEGIQVHFDEPNPFDDDTMITEATIEYIPEVLIPEESDELNHVINLSPIKMNTTSPDASHASLRKTTFEVYEDSPEPGDVKPSEEIQAKILRLADESVKTSTVVIHPNILGDEFGNERDDQYKPLDQDINKIKHTRSKAKTKTPVDEQMPTASDGSLSTRKSRTRGKQVSYVEPSLRVKMRRQSEKFVDAVGEDGFIRPLSSHLSSRDSSIGIQEPIIMKQPETIISLETSEDQVQNPSMGMPTKMPTKVVSTPSLRKFTIEDEPKQKPLTEQDNVNITKRRRPLSNLSNNKIQKVDVGEKVKPHKKKFDLSDDELSVFDLVEESAVGVPKVYKGKPEITVKKKGGRRHSMLV